MESWTQSSPNGDGGQRGRTSITKNLPKSRVDLTGVENGSGPIRILLIEDDDDDALLLEEAVADSGGEFAVTRVARLGEAETVSAESDVDLVLLDLRLPDASGLEMIDELRDVMPETPVVVLTGMPDVGLARAALDAGAQNYLSKREVTPDAIVRVVRDAIDHGNCVGDDSNGHPDCGSHDGGRR